MTEKEEKEYYKMLAAMIISQKNKSKFYPVRSFNFEDEIGRITDVIFQKKPGLFSSMFDDLKILNVPENLSRNEIEKLMSKTEKRTVCTWKNSKGEEFFILNNGKELNGHKSKLFFIKKQNKNDTIESLLNNPSVKEAILKSDVKKVYEKLKDNRHKAVLKKVLKNEIEEISEAKEHSLLKNTVSDFEKDFKTMIIKGNEGLDNYKLAASLILFLPDSEKKNLSRNFRAMGVKSDEDFQMLFSKWRNEALQAKEMSLKPREQVRKRTVSIMHER